METDYRVRYCAKGMDEARRQDTRSSDEPELDCYLLQFWPAPAAPDRVLKQTSAIAAYWHDYARRLPSQALRDVVGNVRGLLPFDPALVHAIDAAAPETQRAIALPAARRACEAAGLTVREDDQPGPGQSPGAHR
ncbi:hypothetical protein [Streptomyces sp. NPDC020996]|uniref:hypothetical protein n=1 Tax=Streptomyces sp. NPDC020996 TaxID=3154791 RepID=UPI0033D42582